jgi:miniconductance mechanosensitive channel
MFDEWWIQSTQALANHSVAAEATALIVLVVVTAILHLTVGRILQGIFYRFVRSTRMKWDDHLVEEGVFKHLFRLSPCLILWAGGRLLQQLGAASGPVVVRIAEVAGVVIVSIVLEALLRAGHSIYQSLPVSKVHPIKGYVQIMRLILWISTVVVAVATAIDRSPMLFLSGLGAMTAVLLLVFKDTILGLVASVQLATNDMLRVGDWIEMPQNYADGDVVDIALHTVKVRNWDMTITTIPTWSLISSGFKNWRSMQESGGRRIKRALLIELSSIRYLGEQEIAGLAGVALLTDYLKRKEEELADYRAQVRGEFAHVATNLRRLTNVGTYRAYLQGWLDAHPQIHRQMTCMVRQLPPQPEGLPLEIYCFTTTTKWAEYEGIQADVFDHALAVASEFGLRVFQAPSSDDLRQVVGRRHADAIADEARTT